MLHSTQVIRIKQPFLCVPDVILDVFHITAFVRQDTPVLFVPAKATVLQFHKSMVREVEGMNWNDTGQPVESDGTILLVQN